MSFSDAPSHMTEELLDARRQAPRAIVLSVYIGAITGFIFLIAICFSISDISATASSPTGVPLIQILYDSTGSVGGACALTSLITVIVLFCANSLMAEGSRSVFAFARDKGLPFSAWLSKVESRRRIPLFAILATAVVQIAFNSIYFGTLTGFNTVITIATEGFCKFVAMQIAEHDHVGYRMYALTDVEQTSRTLCHSSRDSSHASTRTSRI
jgi:choline transport protein